MNHLIENDRHYLAGLIDGEGMIYLTRKQRVHVVGYGPVVGVTNTNLILLNWCLESVGIGMIGRGGGKPEEGQKQGWRWVLRVPEMREFLSMIQPYLRIKEEQAYLLLQYLDIEEDDHEAKNIIYYQLRELNKRGI